MKTRLVPTTLVVLLLILQAQLWFGRGSLPNVSRMVNQLDTQKEKNEQAQLDNSRLVADIRDLKEGLEMVEEKARMELGMVKPNEIYVQFTQK